VFPALNEDQLFVVYVKPLQLDLLRERVAA
jgi:hypothetical protein